MQRAGALLGRLGPHRAAVVSRAAAARSLLSHTQGFPGVVGEGMGMYQAHTHMHMHMHTLITHNNTHASAFYALLIHA